MWREERHVHIGCAAGRRGWPPSLAACNPARVSAENSMQRCLEHLECLLIACPCSLPTTWTGRGCAGWPPARASTASSPRSGQSRLRRPARLHACPAPAARRGSCRRCGTSQPTELRAGKLPSMLPPRLAGAASGQGCRAASLGWHHAPLHLTGAAPAPPSPCRVMVMDRLRGVPLTDLDAVRSITAGTTAAASCLQPDWFQLVSVSLSGPELVHPAGLPPQNTSLEIEKEFPAGPPHPPTPPPTPPTLPLSCS